MAEENFLKTEEDIELPKSVLSKLKVINDTPEVSYEPLAEIVVPSEFSNTHEESKNDCVELVDAVNDDNQKEVSIKDTLLSWEEINAVRNKAVKFASDLHNLLDDELSDSAVQSAVEQYCDEEYDYILRQIPIEQLNYRKVGIRVSSLRAAGFDTLYRIRDYSYSQLMQIHGIGEKSAYLILRELSSLCIDTEKKVKVRPTWSVGADVVVAYYQYNKLSEFHRNMIEALGDVKKEFASLYGFLNQLKGKLSWRLLPKRKKELYSDCAKEMNALLSKELFNEVNGYLEIRKQIYDVKNDTCFEDYRRHKSQYNAAFDSYRRSWVSPSNTVANYSPNRSFSNYNALGSKQKEKGNSGCFIWILIVIGIIIACWFVQCESRIFP